MFVEEIKSELKQLSQERVSEVIVFALHLQIQRDAVRSTSLNRAKWRWDPTHWLTPDEFEKQLDAQ